MEDNKNQKQNDRLLRIMGAYESVAAERAKQRAADGENAADQASHLTEPDGTEVLLSAGVMSHFEAEDVPMQDAVINAHFSETDEKRPAKKKKKPSKAVKGAFSAVISAVRAGSFAIKLVLYISVVLIVSAYCSYYAISAANDVFALVKEDISYTVVIDENTDINSISAELERNGIIKYADVFRLYLFTRLDDVDANEGENAENKLFYPGEHTVSSAMNYSQLYTALASSTRVREVVRVTIPEGVTTDQLIDILVNAGVGSRENYVDAINNYPYKHEFVKLLDETGWRDGRTYRLDGYLFPDTYEFYTDSAEYLVINKLLNTFNLRFWKGYNKEYKEKLDEMYPSLSFDDIVNLAAMVEREGSAAQEYEYIAYVFINRLNSPETFPNLESDATINYILSLSGEHHADLTVDDLNLQSPYNTYVSKGLPPGAICNPGLDALMATVFPTMPVDVYGNDINAYYFVSSKLGNTYYARSYAAHQANIAKVKKENEEYDAQHAAEQ